MNRRDWDRSLTAVGLSIGRESPLIRCGTLLDRGYLATVSPALYALVNHA